MAEKPKTLIECLEQYKNTLKKFNDGFENLNRGLTMEILIGGLGSMDDDLKFIQYTYDDDEWLCDYTKGMREQLKRFINILQKELVKIDSDSEQ